MGEMRGFPLFARGEHTQNIPQDIAKSVSRDGTLVLKPAFLDSFQQVGPPRFFVEDRWYESQRGQKGFTRCG